MVSYLLMAIGTVIVTVSVAATSGTRRAWIGHPITAIPGLLLLVIIILTVAKQGGASYGGRFPVYQLRHSASIWFSIAVTVTFIPGLLVTLHHGEPVLRSLHGILGLTVTVLALLQLVPGFIITKKPQYG
jgi:hypothetical protein